MVVAANNKDNTVKFALFLILIFIFLYIGRFFQVDEELYKSYLTHFPIGVSVFIFMFLYVLVTFFIWLGPKDLFRVTAAVIYGALWSSIFILIAEMFNVVLLFTLSRKLGRAYVQSKIKGRMHQVDEAIAGTSFWRIFWLRFFPIIPLRFLDLGFGLTKISIKKYFIIALLSSPMRIYIIQYMLVVGADSLRNPQVFLQKLMENEVLGWVSLVYIAGAFIVMYILKHQARKKTF